MNITLNSIFLAGTLSLASLSIEAAGFQEISVTDPGHPNIVVGIWYPSEQVPPAQPNTRFERALALDAPVGKTNGGLILISHGYSGWYAGHADTAEALAAAGYIVAAPSHTGNTWSDMSSSIDQWLLDRPRHISRVIDGLLENEQFDELIDREKIGIYGFSAGGYTALGLIGGTPDLNRAKAHCDVTPEEFVCARNWIDELLLAGLQKLPSSSWGADSRIQAASIAAPGFGFAYTKDSLRNISAPIQVWSGELDDSVPTETNAALLAERLPISPETHWIENANHFAFLVMPCREAFKQEDPVEYELVCNDAEGFDRYAFHDAMHIEMVRFFDESLRIQRR